MQLIQSQKARIRWLKSTDGVILLKSSGDWTIDALQNAAGMLEQFSREMRNVSIQWDVSDVGSVDSAGMMLFIHYYDLLKSNKRSIEGVVRVRFYLIDNTTKTVTAPKEFASRVPASSQNAQGAVSALNKAATNVARDLVSWLAEPGWLYK
jgi:ABC-type transporter Mla MlaB component